MQAQTIDLDDNETWYRLRCPVGHTRWRAHPEHFECLECSGHHPCSAPTFQKLRDSVTGREYEREELRFIATERSEKIVQEAE